SIYDMNYYTMWKTNSKADKNHPWYNQKNISYYEPNKIFVEHDSFNYHSYLGDYIRDHYDQIIIDDHTLFRGYSGWYPWINPSAPYDSDERYWDTGRYIA